MLRRVGIAFYAHHFGGPATVPNSNITHPTLDDARHTVTVPISGQAEKCMNFKLKNWQLWSFHVLYVQQGQMLGICMSALKELKQHLKPGLVYRRADLAQWSNAVDRHLRQLVKEGTLQKVSQGVYSYPKKTSFGKAAPEDYKLVEAFLKTDDFLLFSPNAYNTLGVGTTQLYNEQLVYNRKRHGNFKLGNRTFNFQVKPYFPKEVSEGFLLVDLVNNVNKLAEEQDSVLKRVSRVAANMNTASLKRDVQRYGGVRAKKFFTSLDHMAVIHDAELSTSP